MVLIAMGILALFYPSLYMYRKGIRKTSDEGIFIYVVFIIMSIGFVLCGLLTPTNDYEPIWTEVDRIELLQMSDKSDPDYFKVSGDNLVYKTADPESEKSDNPTKFKLTTISLSDTTFVIDNSITKPYIVKSEKKAIGNIFSYSLCSNPKIMYTVYIPEQYGIITE